MQSRGYSLVELVVVLGVIGVMAAASAPYLEAARRESHILGAARVFKGEFVRARSMALMKSANVAMRFEKQADQTTWISTYLDGDGDGVRSADIQSGTDPRIAGPLRLSVPAQSVDVGIRPGTPEIPPAKGTIDPADPIKFSNDSLSFTPLGTATPGTFYLVGPDAQAAVRVTGTNARVRFMLFRGTKWELR